MSFLSTTFTWWKGATWGTKLFTSRKGEKVGTDSEGNVYYRERGVDKHTARRWVVFNGEVEASRVPPEWHGWLHKTIDETPDERRPLIKLWEKPHEPNLTGSIAAYMPPGSLEMGGKRKKATGDYEAWKPE